MNPLYLGFTQLTPLPCCSIWNKQKKHFKIKSPHEKQKKLNYNTPAGFEKMRLHPLYTSNPGPAPLSSPWQERKLDLYNMSELHSALIWNISPLSIFPATCSLWSCWLSGLSSRVILFDNQSSTWNNMNLLDQAIPKNKNWLLNDMSTTYDAMAKHRHGDHSRPMTRLLPPSNFNPPKYGKHQVTKNQTFLCLI